MVTKEQITIWFQQLQDDICSELEDLDGIAEFKQDLWEHEHEGGGRTRLIQEGQVLEKGGVNFSGLGSDMPPNLLKLLKMEDQGEDPITFWATGVSIVLHPRSPRIPIIHMNVRYFEMSNGVWWFGGGIDLTPHYVNAALATDFHQQLKEVCDRHDPDYYAKFKPWADDYFYIKHRQETRGIGGIFFDRLQEEKGKSKEQLWAFVQEVGRAFVPLYRHQVEQTRDLAFGDQELNWQRLRRGRYVEFNLVWDRGTKFGLDTNGRTESILMSMPPRAEWAYCHEPVAGSEEAKTLEQLKKGINWVTVPALS
ncbi:MAG: oxygen-dependent coproporphyrinogen oxidase [Aureispira sp.]